MNRTKQRTSVVAALAVLIGGGAALQTLAAGPEAVSQPEAPLVASQTTVTARVIDPASLVAAFAGGDGVAMAFTDRTSDADLLRGALAGGATFSNNVSAPGRDLTALAVAVSAEAAPATLSTTVSYASTLRAAHAYSGASLQLSPPVAALDLARFAGAYSDQAAEQVTFADEGSQLSDAYYNPELAAGTFASEFGSTPGRDLSSLAAAVSGGEAATGGFASQAGGAENLGSAYHSDTFGTGTFAGSAGAAGAHASLADLAAAVGAESPAGFSTQASSSAAYADTLRAAHAGFGGLDTGFSTEVGGAVSSQFDLDALADAFSEE